MDEKEFTAYLLRTKEISDNKLFKEEELVEFLDKLSYGYENKIVGPDGDDVENGLTKYLVDKFNSEFNLTNKFLQESLNYFINSISPSNLNNVSVIKDTSMLIVVMSTLVKDFDKEEALNRLKEVSMNCGILIV